MSRADLQCTVAGRLVDAVPGIEIKIDAEGGLWTSGWMKPSDGVFETPVSLKEEDVTTFWIYARDARNRYTRVQSEARARSVGAASSVRTVCRGT